MYLACTFGISKYTKQFAQTKSIDRKPFPTSITDMGGSEQPLQHRWLLDFSDDTASVAQLHEKRSPSAITELEPYLHPPGFPASHSVRDPTEAELKQLDLQLKQQREEHTKTLRPAEQRMLMKSAYSKSWQVAFSPLRGLCTSGLALYLSGSRLQAFSLVSTVTVLFVQFRSLLSSRSVFRPVNKVHPLPITSLAPQIIVHTLICAAGVAYALYKANVLGVLPTTESDWIALLPLHSITSPMYRHATSL